MKELEREVITEAIKAIERCVKQHDMDTVLVLCKLCKMIAGEAFSVEIERGEK